MTEKNIRPADEGLSTSQILDAARTHVRRYGENKTNVVDIARILGTSHTTIYRYFRSKAEVFDAIVLQTMNDEEELAKTFIGGSEPAGKRLTDLVLTLHRRKLERFSNDPEVYQLYRRVVIERPDIVKNYANAIVRLIVTILEEGVKAQEFKLDDVQAAAEVVRDAVTVFVHPAHVETSARSGISMEPAIKRVLMTLITAFASGITFTHP